MPVANLGDVQIGYERSGAGEPLLLIMGMSGSALHWGEPFLAPLREQFDVIAIDNRGVGESTRIQGSILIAEMARDAAGVLGSLQTGPAHVMGISMGGMIAQELALSHPDLVRTLTIGCSYCGGPGSSLSDPEVMRTLSEAMLSGDRRRAIRAGWEANVAAPAVDDPELYERFLAVAARRPVAVPVIMAQMQAIAGHDTSARLPALKPPTLVIHGTEDRMLPVANGELIASLIPGARLELLDGTGHLFFWERPAESAGMLRAHAAS